MSTTVDTLVTKYVMDASSYTKGADDVANKTKSLGGMKSPLNGLASGMGADMQSVLGTLAEVGAGITSVVGVAAAAAVAIGAAIGAVVAAEVSLATKTFEVGKQMVDVSSKFNEMTTVFGGALGSLEKGKQVMAGLQDYAENSAFGLNELAQAAQRLVVGGMNIQRFVPLVEKFALAVNGTDPQGLEQVASAFLRIKGGQFGEAMEVFRKSGISSQDLAAQGIKVDKGGQVLSSPEELFQALEKMSGKGSRIDGVVTALMGSTTVKLSNFGDAIERAKVAIGTVLENYAVPIIEKFTNKINDFTKSGGMAALGQAMSSFASSIFNADTFNLDDIAAKFAGGMAAIYTAATDGIYGLKLFGSIVWEVGKGLVHFWNYIREFFTSPLTSGSAFRDMQSQFADSSKAIGSAIQTASEHMNLNVSGVYNDKYNSTLQAMKDAREKAKVAAGGLPNTGDGGGGNEPLKVSPLDAAQTAFLAQIAKNTKDMVDVQAAILGGGNLAAQGISAADLSLRRGRGSKGYDPMTMLGVFVQNMSLEVQRSG